MRSPVVIAVSLVFLVLVAAGCSIGSLSPLYKPENMAADERIEGFWQLVGTKEDEKKGDPDAECRVQIEADEHGFYRVGFVDGSGAAPPIPPELRERTMVGQVMRVAVVKLDTGAIFLDVALHPSARDSEAFALFAVPVHYHYKISLTRKQLKLWQLDQEWLREWLTRHPDDLVYVRMHGEYVLPPYHKHAKVEIGERILLSDTTERLQGFLASHADTAEAWSEEPMTFERFEPASEDEVRGEP